MSIEEQIDRAVGGVVWNAANYPEAAQSRMLGADISPLREKITSAVMPVVKRAQAAAIREAADALNEDFQSIPAWTEAYREGVRTDEWMQGGVRMTMSAIGVLRARADRIESEAPSV